MTKARTVTIIEPSYYRDFSCAGDKCPDHCCHSWGITVNKKTYKTLKKHQNIILRQFANEHFKLARNSDAQWAFITLDNQGNCPILDENGLCNIQKYGGHQLLPNTCQDYPRRANWMGNRIESSLFLSCPSAAESILFNPTAMIFEENHKPLEKINHGNIGGLTQKTMPKGLPSIREFCFMIMLDEDVSFNERLFCMGLFLKQAEKHLHNPSDLSTFITSFTHLYNEGKPQTMFNKLPNVEKVKWHIFSHQDSQLIKNTTIFTDKNTNKGLTNSNIRFQQCRDQLLHLFTNKGVAVPTNLEQENDIFDFIDEKIEGSSLLFEEILQAGKEQYLADYFNKNPQIMLNYIMYYLYDSQFLSEHKKSPFEFFRIMMIDFFMIQSYLCAIAVNQKGLTKEWVIKIFQSYSRRRQHNKDFILRMEKQLQESGIDGAGAIFSLLK